MTSKTTTCVIQEGCANALALNKDNSQVVVAGRKVIKIFNLRENEIEENRNLKFGKNLNLNFSCNDVAWNHVDDNYLATAATNGAVVVWEINSRTNQIYRDHKRTVNKISFHSVDPKLLLSGSQDGTVKCFDLRVKEAIKTFESRTESVRDVKFSPHYPDTFAAVSENGQVQLWDLRKLDKYFQQFTAHSGPIFACDWHPETHELATASRDKSIKVWADLATTPSCEYAINTIFPVGRIKWRPQKRFHIASCALQLDSSIYVWDVRRPYVPFAVFKEHKEAPTGIAWRGDPQSLLSTSRISINNNFYGTLVHHIFMDASRPAYKANPQAHMFNGDGSVLLACRTSDILPTTRTTPTNSRFKRLDSDSFYQASSRVHEFKAQSNNPKWFEICAEKYLLSGKLNEICDHNSLIARSIGRADISSIWSIIKTFFQVPFESDITTEITSAIPSVFEYDLKSLKSDVVSGDENSDTDETAHEFRNFVQPFMRQKPRRLGYMNQPRADFSFGEGELEPTIIDYEDEVPNDVDENWSLPKEAFPLRHDIHNRPPPLEQFSNHSPDVNEQLTPVRVVLEDLQPNQLSVNWTFKPKFWNPMKHVEDLLRHHVDKNDIQTAVSVLIALGDRRKDLRISLVEQEHWIEEYLALLARFKLWEASTKIIKTSWIPAISQLSQQSTSMRLCCPECTKPLQRVAWLCDRCHSSDHARCSMCRQVVKGIYTWCVICAHGGHVDHMNDWFKTNKQCPTGCGHTCR